LFSPAAVSVHSHNLQLQKSPSQIFGRNSGNSIDISKAFFEMGIWKFESSQVDPAVLRAANQIYFFGSKLKVGRL
jgi:hypothetical protein